MPQSPDRPTRWLFDDFAFDPHTLELTRGGRSQALEPLPARILSRLLSSPGRMVTREELRRLGWPRLPDVADDSLNTCIRQIREALDDDARSPRYVETLRGRGYRFAAPVRADGPSRRPAPLLWALLTVAASGVLILRATWRPPPVPQEVPAAARELLARIDWAQERSFDWVKATAMADSAVLRYPELAETHGRRAELSIMAGHTRDAWRSTRTALAIDARNVQALRALAHLEMFAGRWDAAAASLEDALDAAPEDPRTWIAIAYRHTVRGDAKAAADAIDRAMRIDPLSPIIIGDAGLLHLWGGRYARAADTCARAVEVEPRATWAIDCAFDAYRLAGSRHAVEWATRWLSMFAAAGVQLASGGEDPVARVLSERVRQAERAGRRGYALAQALAEVGRTEDALDALEAAARRPGLAVLGAAVDPRLQALRGEPRYRAVLDRLGL